MKEYLMSVDKFEQPKVLKDLDAINIYIQRLLLLTPGSIQSHPEMGVGLITKWRYCWFEDIGDLLREIERQIETYLPNLSGVNVNITPVEEKKEIILEISVNKTLYRYETDSDNFTLNNL